MNPEKEKIMFDCADRIIALANEMSKTDGVGNVGVAIRYAAARYSVFEASLQSGDLAKNKDKHSQFFEKTFAEMLQRNFEEYIELTSQNTTD